ncbi:family 43 glycosylhydrolase [Pontiellaceae bacterium B12227]|nr:family 43 glycosylhydrolase [Pontiellaceae bacterium B12227]
MKQWTNLMLATASLAVAATALAGNPILRETDPEFVYACDPAAEVFEGKVYVYCSHDQPDARNYESMKDYVILESSDMTNWINHGVMLDPQLDPGFEHFKSNMNAPVAAYKDGWYYWYFPGNIFEVGVAKSRTPVGPWEAAVPHAITKIFDPTVFVDDDGQAYIYGNDHFVDMGDPGRHIMGAKLKDNMVELDGPWIRLSKERVNEAVHIFKRKGIYYFSARVGGVTKYWMADSPLPQYAELKGELAPNSPHSPNHTSAIEFNGQWYLFYHRGDVNQGSRFKRTLCVDKMTFREDGTIEPVVYTLDDDVEITDPPKQRRARKKAKAPAAQEPERVAEGYIRREAEEFSEQSGTKVQGQQDGGQSRGLAYISNGDWSSYSAIYFGEDPAAEIPFRVRVSSQDGGGAIELRLGSLAGTVVGTIPVASTGDWNNFVTLSAVLSGVSGTHMLYLRYTGGAGNLLNLNWFEWGPGKPVRSAKVVQSAGRAPNPFITHMFTADPSAHVWEDGRLYVYPSTDVPGGRGYQKMDGYHVFSTDDMIDWTDHGEILHSRDVEWGRKQGGYMWAPDCAYKDGTYYFYFPHPTETKAKGSWKIGIATSTSPVSGFKVQGYIKGLEPHIDPCVFIDDDGRAYLYYGGYGQPFVARLKENMEEVEGPSVPMAGLEDFREGAFVFKRNGIYYMIYPDNTPGGHRMNYAMTDNPIGPWMAKGVILEKTSSLTTHGSVVEYKGQWYLFYHNAALSGGKATNRSICFDKVSFNEDGTINRVEQTLGVDQ